MKDGDVAFMLDIGNGVGVSEFEDMKATISQSADYLAISPDKAKLAVATFGGNRPEVSVHFKTGYNNARVERLIGNMTITPATGGGRLTGHALGKIASMVFQESKGERPDRLNYIVAFLTGTSKRFNLLVSKAKEVKAAGTVVIAVAVGPNFMPDSQLEAIASPKLIFQYENTTALRDNFPFFFKRLVVHCNCMKKADMMFMLDTSKGTQREDFEKMKSAVKTIVSWVNIGEDEAKIAMASFGARVKVAFNFKRKLNNENAQTVIGKFKKMAGRKRKMFKHFSFMNEKVFAVSNGGRADADQYVIFFVSGESKRSTKFIKSAKKFTKEGKKVMAVVIGEMPVEQISALVSEPSMAIRISNYDELPIAIEQIKSIALNCG